MTRQTVRQESDRSDLQYNNYIKNINNKINNIYNINNSIKKHY